MPNCRSEKGPAHPGWAPIRQRTRAGDMGRRQCRIPLLACLVVALGGLLAGCGGEDRMPTAPVEGKVLYNGEPLKFGSVVFIPEAGPPARGTIQPDGTFYLSTYKDGDGAILGENRVEITCSTNQDPDAPPPDPNVEMPVGESLIPQRYTQAQTSGLTREVKEGGNSFEFKLTDEPAG